MWTTLKISAGITFAIVGLGVAILVVSPWHDTPPPECPPGQVLIGAGYGSDGYCEVPDPNVPLDTGPDWELWMVVAAILSIGVGMLFAVVTAVVALSRGLWAGLEGQSRPGDELSEAASSQGSR